MQNTKNSCAEPLLSRRRFIGATVALGALVCQPAFAHLALPLSGRRGLALRNLHTGEFLRTDYWEDGKYQADALSQLGHLLRDHRSDESMQPDTALLDLLSDLQNKIGNNSTWQVISAFRSKSTNEKLRKSGNGVARNSFHCLGKAIDVRLTGTPLRELHRAALAQRAGGVGYYPKSDFVHLDSGPIRSW